MAIKRRRQKNSVVQLRPESLALILTVATEKDGDTGCGRGEGGAPTTEKRHTGPQDSAQGLGGAT